MSLTTSYGTYTTPSSYVTVMNSENSHWHNSISCSLDGKYVLATNVNSGGGRLSTDYGRNFTYISKARGDSRGMRTIWPNCCAVSSDGKYMAIGSHHRTSDMSLNQLGIYISNNYGLTWSNDNSFLNNVIILQRLSQSCLSVTISDNGQYLTLGTDSTLYISSDYGNNWVAKLSGGNYYNVFITTASTNGKYICGCIVNTNPNDNNKTDGKTFFTSVDYGENWAQNILTIEPDIKITHMKLSRTGQTLVVISKDNTYGGRIYISKNFIKSIVNGTTPTFTRTNFPTLLNYNYTYIYINYI